LSIDPSRHYK